MTRSPTADVDRLLAEAAAEPLSGWDFTRLAGRVVSDPLPWDYVALAAEAAGRAERVLDIDTGGGEVLATLGVPSGSVALEPYPPNLPVARARLLPYGIEVRARTDRRLPCDSSDFDLVLNRHGALDPAEIARVLRPGGVFWTQQVGADNDAELNTALGAAPVVGGLSSAADAAALLRSRRSATCCGRTRRGRGPASSMWVRSCCTCEPSAGRFPTSTSYATARSCWRSTGSSVPTAPSPSPTTACCCTPSDRPQ